MSSYAKIRMLMKPILKYNPYTFKMFRSITFLKLNTVVIAIDRGVTAGLQSSRCRRAHIHFWFLHVLFLNLIKT